MRIDAHQHYWTIGRGDYGWITPEIAALYRDFLPQDLLPAREKHGITGTILVQAAPTYAETEYILALSEHEPSVLGVVGWLDLFDPHHRAQYEKHQLHPKYKGFRIMVQDMPDASIILRPEFVRAVQYFEKEEVPVDILVTHEQLDSVIKLIDQVPNLHGVINHIAKPDIKGEMSVTWVRQMEKIASYPNLYCKLSGMVTEADHEHWVVSDFTNYIHSVIDLFGVDRVMYGSDWPVCLLAATYDEVWDIVESALPDNWSSSDREKLFGLNAKRFYNLSTFR